MFGRSSQGGNGPSSDDWKTWREDVEKRLRSLERYLWLAVGALWVIVAVCGLFAPRFLKVMGLTP
jgi:hypothetical protein